MIGDYITEQEKAYQVESMPQGLKRITHYTNNKGVEYSFNNRKYYADIENGNVYRHYGTQLYTRHPFTNKKATVIIDDSNKHVCIYNGPKLKKHMEEETETS